MDRELIWLARLRRLSPTQKAFKYLRAYNRNWCFPEDIWLWNYVTNQKGWTRR